MTFTGGGQRGTDGALLLKVAFAVQLDRQYFAQAAFAVTAAVEAARAAKHRQPAAVADEIFHPVEINGIEIGAMREVIEKNHVEIFQLLEKNIVDRKGNQ